MKIEDILFIAFFIASIILVLWYVFGQSPTLEQGMLAVVVGLLIKNHGDIGELKGRLEEHLRKHG